MFLKTKNQKSKTNSGFTLIEMIVAITILAIIMLSIFGVYSNIINVNKRLELARALQENSRNITETVARDIRENGIDFGYYDGLTEDKKLDYIGSGNSVLAIKGGIKYYLMKDILGTITICDIGVFDKDCFFGSMSGSSFKKISDDRVEIRNVKFFISGSGSENIQNTNAEGKVTMVFDLGIAPGKGILSDLAKEYSIKVQTTISEKIYKR
ncbi:prepilin-type N-terminal cleavage/methylation domain-containing protein [Candidatus Gracilibacteria bacterium]|nr:prepilin-type N-terminal cleavage/methylation domain-containing protein [Candidatus Gracilibacteria bacterium]